MTTTTPTSARPGPAPTDTLAQPRDHRRERLAALSGIVFVAILLVHVALQGDGVPSATDSADKIVRYLADHRTGIQIGTYLQGLAMVAYLWFVASLWRHVRPAEGDPGRLSIVPVAAVAVLTALIGVHIATLTTLALRADAAVDSHVLATGYLFAMVVLGLSAFPCAALTGAVGVLALRTGVLPRWFGRLSLVAAALWLAAGAGAASEHDLWQGVGFAAFAVWLAWTAIASVLVYRRTPTVTSPPC